MRQTLNFVYADLNDQYFEWFCAALSKNIPITEALIQEKSLMLRVGMGYDDFTASNGWLDSFKIRHDIKCSILNGLLGDLNGRLIAKLNYKVAKSSSLINVEHTHMSTLVS